ncbi:MAG: SGNH/GDSL hydrolase family protein [Eubacteriales bacterium]|nr:SGNH/GDSL hydrolase family protein [Eubacteriales bacterium]
MRRRGMRAAALLLAAGMLLAAGCGGTASASGTSAAPAVSGGTAEGAGAAVAGGTVAGTASEAATETAANAGEASSAQDAGAASYDYSGRKVSISGDSISTFSGYIPDSYNQNYPADDLQDVSQTWWMQVIQNKGMVLLSNASYSGGLISGDSMDTTGQHACGFTRTNDLRGADGTDPDVIMVMSGTNDFLNARPIGSYTEGEAIAEEGVVWDFSDAYALMLTKLKAQYPNARIVCMTCIPVTRWSDENRQEYSAAVNDLGVTIEAYNEKIKEVAAIFDCPVVDTYRSFTDAESSQYTYDGVHPNAAGAKKMADYVTANLY